VLSGLLKLAQLAVYSFPFQVNDEFAFGGSCGPVSEISKREQAAPVIQLDLECASPAGR
jgi:hypothetical protein